MRKSLGWHFKGENFSLHISYIFEGTLCLVKDRALVDMIFRYRPIASFTVFNDAALIIYSKQQNPGG